MEYLQSRSYRTSKYVIGKLDSDVVSTLKEYCYELHSNSLKKSHSENLAGNLKEEYALPKYITDYLEPYVNEMSLCFSKENSVDLLAQKVRRWTQEKSWVNFQKKYEFNPIHNHSGYYSYVIWLQIPYDVEEEMSLDFVKNSNTPSATAFSLVYPDPTGLVVHEDFFPSKKDEGTFLMFPSRLSHLVYPFYTSDNYRISISGNVIPVNVPYLA